jgi:hypothetical protein
MLFDSCSLQWIAGKAFYEQVVGKLNLVNRGGSWSILSGMILWIISDTDTALYFLTMTNDHTNKGYHFICRYLQKTRSYRPYSYHIIFLLATAATAAAWEDLQASFSRRRKSEKPGYPTSPLDERQSNQQYKSIYSIRSIPRV